MKNSEELREELDVYAAMKTVCLLRYTTDKGSVIALQDTITRTYKEGEMIYLQTESGLHIELQKLVAIDDKPLVDFC